LNGKVFRKYDESLKTITEMQQAGTSIRKLDDMEFGRRLAVDKELEKSPQAQHINAGKLSFQGFTGNRTYRHLPFIFSF
jgi:peptidylprolyl isomerase domain and WD repeat-containing protein 1